MRWPAGWSGRGLAPYSIGSGSSWSPGKFPARSSGDAFPLVGLPECIAPTVQSFSASSVPLPPAIFRLEQVFAGDREAYPIKVSVERVNKRLECSIKRIGFAKVDEVDLGQFLGNFCIGYTASQHPYKPLVVFRRVSDLVLAGTDTTESGVMRKKELSALSMPAVDFLLPFGSEWNVLPVDPGLPLELHERVVKLAHEILVFSRTGNEDIGHGAYRQRLVKSRTIAKRESTQFAARERENHACPLTVQ